MTSNILDRCPWCGQPSQMVFVCDRNECGSCRRPLMDYCDGETACPPEKIIDD